MKKIFYISLIALFFFTACEQSDKSVLSQEKYEGAAIELDTVEILFSDSAIVKVKLIADKQLILDNDDMEFPNGIYLQFYDKLGRVTSTLKGNKGYYFNKENFYRAEGNVILNSLSSGDELSSEELIWEPDEEELKTEKFVTIKSDGEVHKGEGLTADQDFSRYKILKPIGTIKVGAQKKTAKKPSDTPQQVKRNRKKIIRPNKLN